MPRRRLTGSAGVVFHVINRGAKRDRLFDSPGEYDAFENLLICLQKDLQISIYAYCLMPNHWHLVVRPENDRDLSRYMHDVTGTHAVQWNLARNVVGQGAVYQGRFRAIPVQSNHYFLCLCRYVERNPLRAGLVKRARDWKWSSLWRRLHGFDDFLNEWPVSRPEPWIDHVDAATTTDPDLDAIRSAVRGNVPYGAESWRLETAARLGLPALERGRGRPQKIRTLKNLPTFF